MRNWAIFAVEILSTVSTPHYKFQLNCTWRYKSLKIGSVSWISSSFLFLRCKSYHTVEAGYPIALEFGRQKYGVRAHIIGSRFAWNMINTHKVTEKLHK